MSEDTALLAEMMLQAEVFCATIEGRVKDRPASVEADDLRLKISQCRGALSQLQIQHDEDSSLSLIQR